MLQQLEGALTKVLLPISILLVRAGFTFESFYLLARRLYVEAANRECSRRGERSSDARVAILTGIPKREVAFVTRNAHRHQQAEPTNAIIFAEILTAWYSNPNYLGPYGVPLELAFDDQSSRDFRSLVGTLDVRKSLDPNKMLSEMIDAGLVSRVGSDHFRPNARAVMLSDSLSAEAFEHLGNSIFNLVNTIGWNLNPDNQPKLVERTIFSDTGLVQRKKTEFDEFLKQKIREVSSDIDDWLKQAEMQQAGLQEAKYEVGLSIFQYSHKREDSVSVTSNVEKL